MKLPERYYYRVETLHEIDKNYTVENLIHFAATSRLELCVRLTNTNFVDGYCLNVNDKIRTAWRSHGRTIIPNVEFNCKYGYIRCNLHNPIEENIVDPETSTIEDVCCLFSISSDVIRKGELSLIKGEKINAIWLNMPRELRFESFSMNLAPLCFKMNSDYFFDISELFITKIELDKLNNGGELVEFQRNEANFDIKPHPTVERHAINREQILSAALRLIEEQPNVFNDNCRKKDGSINYSAFARELLERHHFFPNGEPPIKTQESVAGILSNAYKSPNQK